MNIAVFRKKTFMCVGTSTLLATIDFLKAVLEGGDFEHFIK